jgi:hypothetical protein
MSPVAGVLARGLDLRDSHASGRLVLRTAPAALRTAWAGAGATSARLRYRDLVDFNFDQAVAGSVGRHEADSDRRARPAI